MRHPARKGTTRRLAARATARRTARLHPRPFTHELSLPTLRFPVLRRPAPKLERPSLPRYPLPCAPALPAQRQGSLPRCSLAFEAPSPLGSRVRRAARKPRGRRRGRAPRPRLLSAVRASRQAPPSTLPPRPRARPRPTRFESRRGESRQGARAVEAPQPSGMLAGALRPNPTTNTSLLWLRVASGRITRHWPYCPATARLKSAKSPPMKNLATK